MTEAGQTSSGPTAAGSSGFETRRLAARVIDDVITRRLALDETLELALAAPDARALDDRDKGLVRAIATSAIRYFGVISKALVARLGAGARVQAAPFWSV
jgi:16S rRNA (cytosine967-C5)-methyltransferase